VPSTQQADNSIHEDQLLNFLVNTIDEEVDLDFAPNAEATSEDIYEVLVGACADEDLSRHSARTATTHFTKTQLCTTSARSSI